MLGLVDLSYPNNLLVLEEFWDDVAAQVMRFSIMLAQQIVCNSKCMLIMGPRGKRQ